MAEETTEYLSEIIVRAKRRSGVNPKSVPKLALTAAYNQPRITSGGSSAALIPQLEEIKVTAPRPRPVSGLTRAEFNLGRARAASLESILAADMARKIEAALPEIVVTGRRIAPIVGRVLGPVVNIVDIVSQVATEFSIQRLDEAGRLATQTVESRRDSPVQTMQPEVLPEIVVKAQRIVPRTLTQTLDFSLPRTTLPQVLLPKSFLFPSQTPTAEPKITVPKPKLRQRSETKTQQLTQILTGTLPQIQFLTNPKNISRSRLLRIGRTGTRTDQLTRDLTGVQTRVLSSPKLAQTQCPPCKQKRKKNRTKCYKTLVKQKLNPANDKVYKLVQINCDTGREIYKRRGKI